MTTRRTSSAPPRARVDGPAKVTGARALRGRIRRRRPAARLRRVARHRARPHQAIDTQPPEAVPGVVEVYHPRATGPARPGSTPVLPATTWRRPGTPFRALNDDTILFSGPAGGPGGGARTSNRRATRPRWSQVDYDAEAPRPTSTAARGTPTSRRRSAAASSRRPSPAATPTGLRGRARCGCSTSTGSRPSTTTRWSRTPPPWCGRATAPSRSTTRSRASEHAEVHHGRVRPRRTVRVVTPYLGGGFGSGLRPQYQLFLAVLAALDAGALRARRPDPRPDVLVQPPPGGDPDRVARRRRRTGAAPPSSTTRSATPRASRTTRRPSSTGPACCTSATTPRSPTRSRSSTRTRPATCGRPAPPTGVFALESRHGRAGVRAGIDPLGLRLRNYSRSRPEHREEAWTSKALRSLLSPGAPTASAGRRARRARGPCGRATSSSAGAWRPASGKPDDEDHRPAPS